MSLTAMEKYHQRVAASSSMLCVGLDSDITRLPERFLHTPQPQLEFNTWIIDQTHQYVCAYKPNLAYYEARGDQGWRELKLTIEYLQEHHPDIFIIADAKRADIDATNRGYVTAVFDWLGCDAITLNPYLGQEALQPFLERQDKVSIILCRTSNPGSAEIQDLVIGSDGRRLWQVVARKVTEEWNENGNCMLVMGATQPQELRTARELAGEMPLLVPGIGAQGGTIEEVLKYGLNNAGSGLIINSSRGVIFAEEPANICEYIFKNFLASSGS